MDYKVILQGLLDKVTGAIAASFCGTDGIGVETIFNDQQIDPLMAEVELATAYKVVTEVARHLEAGDIQELVFETQVYLVVLERLSPDYFLSLILKPTGNLGRARLELKRAVGELSHDM